VALSSTETHLVNNYEWRDLALVFTVANTQRATFVGMAWIQPQITISARGRADASAATRADAGQEPGALEDRHLC
jgi:lipopolysaccharide transport system ATP-binding protein